MEVPELAKEEVTKEMDKQKKALRILEEW